MIKYNIVSSYLFLFSLIISILSLPSCSTDDISSCEETKTVPDDEKDSVDNSSFSTTVTISFDNTVTVSNPMAARLYFSGRQRTGNSRFDSRRDRIHPLRNNCQRQGKDI